MAELKKGDKIYALDEKDLAETHGQLYKAGVVTEFGKDLNGPYMIVTDVQPEKSIIQQLEETMEAVKCEICDNYCKHPCNSEIDQEQLDRICENCPLNRL